MGIIILNSKTLNRMSSQIKDFCERSVSKYDKALPESAVKALKSGIYGSVFKFKTCFCHHFTEEGEHCVTANLPAEAAKKCKGVMFGSVWSPTKLTCGKAQKGHTVCTADRCPYVRDGKPCPYYQEQ